VNNILPIFILENGIADKFDKYRAQFIVVHIKQTKQAMDAGANVIGYLHWSFMDNYEWLEGYKHEAKFGLFRIDYDKSMEAESDFRRRKTKGAMALEWLIKESLSQNKDGVMSNSAIADAEKKFGTFAADGSRIVPAMSHGSQD